MSNAASPTAVIVIALTRKGKCPDEHAAKNHWVVDCEDKVWVTFATLEMYALIKARAAKAAALIAKPLPIAAVEFPTSSVSL